MVFRFKISSGLLRFLHETKMLRQFQILEQVVSDEVVSGVEEVAYF